MNSKPGLEVDDFNKEILLLKETLSKKKSDIDTQILSIIENDNYETSLDNKQ